MPNQKRKIVATVLLLMLIGPNLIAASSLQLSSDFGLDTNPFRLSDEFDPDAAFFTRVGLSGHYDISDNYRFFGRHQSYFYADEEDADSSKTTLGGYYSTRFKLNDRSSRLRIGLQFSHRDKTYISRLAGERGIATTPDPDAPGEEIETDAGDRYDYDESRLDFRLATRLNKKNRLSGTLKLRDRTYASFPATDLSILDYVTLSLEGAWRYQLASGNRWLLGLNHVTREYNDRRNRDSLGNSIAGSNLEQDSVISRIEYNSRLQDKLRLDYRLSYEIRDDNGGDYYNSRYARIRVKAVYGLDHTRQLVAILTYSDRRYPERIDSGGSSATEDDEVNEQSGYQLNIHYRIPHLAVKNLRYVWSYRLDRFDSDFPEYRYDRSRVTFGIDYRIE